MNIDWSKAPEGFPLWLEGTNEEHRKHSGWYRNSGLVYEGSHGGQWRGCREGQFFTVHRNPGPITWTGEGLPPIGIEIEAMMRRNMHDDYAWRRAKVVHGCIPGSEGEVLVYDVETTSPAWVDEFRPVRTPEQIAAQVRSDAIREMIRVWGVAPTGVEYNFAHERAAQLYDAGYHKQQEP